MPIKMFGKTYPNFAAAERAAARRPGVGDPGAYTATVARAEGELHKPKRRKKKKAE